MNITGYEYKRAIPMKPLVEPRFRSGELPPDDGNRTALKIFCEAHDQNASEIIDFFKEHGQYWKARVFLELLWEYDNRQS